MPPLTTLTPLTVGACLPQENDEAPIWMGNPGAFFWYAGFTFVVGFMLLNLYIGVIFSQFTRIRLMGQGSAFLTNDQQEWAELTKMVFKLRPSEKSQTPRNKMRRFVYQIVINGRFDMFMMLVVLTNLGVLASRTYSDTPETILLFEKLNYAFTACYVTEVILKVSNPLLRP